MPDGTPAYYDATTGALKPRTLVEVNMREGTNVKGLKSTSSDVPAWDGSGGMNKGGATQLYAPDVKKAKPNITPIQ